MWRGEVGFPHAVSTPSAPGPAGAIFWCHSMLIRVTCPCGHIGIVSAETLPRSMTCSACGASRHVEVREGRRMASAEAVMEQNATVSLPKLSDLGLAWRTTTRRGLRYGRPQNNAWAAFLRGSFAATTQLKLAKLALPLREVMIRQLAAIGCEV